MPLTAISAPASGFLHWAAMHRSATLVLSFALVTLIAWLDYATGYAWRFAILYLIPVALVTWSCGSRTGLFIVAVSSFFWLIGFPHPYKDNAPFYWEGLSILLVNITIALLLARLHRSLSLADERFRRVLEELPAAIYALDEKSGQLLYVNPALAKLLDTMPETLNADDLTRRFGPPPRPDRSLPASAGFDSTFQTKELRDPVDDHWYQIQSGLISWKSGHPIRLQFITDISDQRQAQSLRRQQKKMERQTARLAELTEVASSLAHELNQPLTAIASYSDACLRLLDNRRFDRAELVTAMQKSRDQALRAGRIIGRIRSFIRSRRPDPSRFDMNELMLESIELLEAARDEHALRTELRLTPHPLMAHADRTLMAQVIHNLMQNAIDAMQTIPIDKRRLTITTDREADGAIALTFADCGPGIPDYLAESAYVALFSTKEKGLGLGLSICRSVIEAHGGRIWHEANPSGGCIFHVRLPAEITEDPK
ncbi:MAG: ATP-binding protein [Propionivibrio sp.]